MEISSQLPSSCPSTILQEYPSLKKRFLCDREEMFFLRNLNIGETKSRPVSTPPPPRLVISRWWSVLPKIMGKSHISKL